MFHLLSFLFFSLYVICAVPFSGRGRPKLAAECSALHGAAHRDEGENDRNDKENNVFHSINRISVGRRLPFLVFLIPFTALITLKIQIIPFTILIRASPCTAVP